MKEIKVEFHRFGSVVVGKVLSMPEELRGKGKIMVSTEYQISSCEYPMFFINALCLWGTDREKDAKYFVYTYHEEKNAKNAILAFTRMINEWNSEHRDILTDAEKEYLSAVIKPFKNRITYIIKKRYGKDKEYLHIGMIPENFYLPTFKKGTMYAGMKAGKAYILQEIGLE